MRSRTKNVMDVKSTWKIRARHRRRWSGRAEIEVTKCFPLYPCSIFRDLCFILTRFGTRLKGVNKSCRS